MSWFRHHIGADFDPKFRTIARLSGEPIERVTFVFWALCSREAEKGGIDGFDPEVIADHLGCDRNSISKILEALAEKGVTGAGKIASWDERQYQDNSAERMRRYRQRRLEAGSTSGFKPKPWLYDRDDRACVYCGSEANICIDHMVPISLGGTDDDKNLAVACKSCNSGKAGRTPEDAGLSFKSLTAKERYADYKAVTDGCYAVTVTDCQNRTDSEQNRAEEESDSESVRDRRTAKQAVLPGAKAKRGSRIGAWQPSPELRQFAVEHGVPRDRVRAVFDTFHDYWVQQPGQKGVKLDWTATWRNWVRREGERAATPRSNGHGRYEPPSVVRAAANVLARLQQGDADDERAGEAEDADDLPLIVGA
jgi:5-methylcytosine-specific restriction endonuclease McrA